MSLFLPSLHAVDAGISVFPRYKDDIRKLPIYVSGVASENLNAGDHVCMTEEEATYPYKWRKALVEDATGCVFADCSKNHMVNIFLGTYQVRINVNKIEYFIKWHDFTLVKMASGQEHILLTDYERFVGHLESWESSNKA